MPALNLAQSEAIHYLDGPLLVLAGAGSGKTRVITQKIAYLIEQCDYDSRHIAAITFTNKAAHEMRERVAKRLKQKPEGLTVSTFHALGVRILREEARALGYKPQFSILDAHDCFALVAELSGSSDKGTIYRLQSIISGWKNALMSPDHAKSVAVSEHEKLAANLYASYGTSLKAYQAVDFDDLILRPVELFARHPEILDKWQNRLRYLLVDEYQDTNAGQYQMLRQLAGVRAAFTAVGDDDQAIYGWRGADVENLRGLPRDYPNLKLIKLEQNYRSTINILRVANTLIAHNPKLFEKRLWSDLGQGDPIRVNAYPDSEKEAENVVMNVQAHKFQHRGSFADYAILYRGNFQARIVEQFLRNQRIPYVVSGGQSFFDKTEIKDITCYLRLIANPEDDPAFIRAITTPRRGVGNSTLEALGTYAGGRHLPLFSAASEEGFAQRVAPRQLAPLREFCQFIQSLAERARRESVDVVTTSLLDAIGYEAWLYSEEERASARARWESVLELKDWLVRRSVEENKNLLELTQTIALINMLNRQESDNAPDAVQLSTLHAAKGLEFKHVFLIGVEEEILPHRESQSPEKLEEERRLMYVGITRAQRSLYISYAKRRRQGREFVSAEASRFIAEMGQEGVHFADSKTAEHLSKEDARARIAALQSRLQQGK